VLLSALAVTLAACNEEQPPAHTPAAAPAPAATNSQLVCLDLGQHYTARLTDSLNSPSSVKENNFAALPAGRQVLAGVPFEIGGILQLAGLKLQEWGRAEFPEEIKGIKVGRSFAKLHLLHGAGGVYDGEGTAIARLVLHYQDESTHDLAIKVGQHVRDWWGDPKQRLIGNTSELAWSGSNPALQRFGDGKGTLRVYRTTFINPNPELVVTSVDYVSNMANSSPFLIGLTVE
jgi:hypothetical protein